MATGNRQMKPWAEYHPAFARITLQAVAQGYRATFTQKTEAHSFVRAAQKFAASVRRDAAAPEALRMACSELPGGVLWNLPKLHEEGYWVILAGPRPQAMPRLSPDEIAASLP